MFDAALSETPFPDDEPRAPAPGVFASSTCSAGLRWRRRRSRRVRPARRARRATSTGPSISPQSRRPSPNCARALRPTAATANLSRVEGDVVRVRMTGACVGCQLASMTVLGVRMKLIEKLGFPVKVVPV